LPIPCLHRANRNAGTIESEISEQGNPPRVGLKADWYKTVKMIRALWLSV
jgi:hypothetical protein